MEIKDVRTIHKCRACDCPDLTTILDLGEQYVSDFRSDNSKPNAYPIEGVICSNCKLVQLRHTTPSGEMYHENYGFKSSISDSIKNDLKEVVAQVRDIQPSIKSWLDIASNDGYLLSQVPAEIYRVGVDPIAKYCKEAEKHADLIVNDFFPTAIPSAVDYDINGTYEKPQKFDAITSISCFYDMDDPNGFVAGVKKVLVDDGVWCIQQNYLLATMQQYALDNFCHEHIEYYTLLALEHLLNRHGLEVFDLSTSDVNGGSIRTFVCHKGKRPIADSVQKQRDIEDGYGLNELKPYLLFGEKAIEKMRVLKALVDGLNKKGKEVYILAASTRGATLWQAAGITEQDVPYAVERNSEKVGKYFSAVGMPIISEETARLNKPAYMIVAPWFFAGEIIKREAQYVKDGGHLIVPLPELRVI